MFNFKMLVTAGVIAMAIVGTPAYGDVIFSDTFDTGSPIDSQADFESVYRVDPDRNGAVRWFYNASSGFNNTGGLNASNGDGTWNTRLAGFEGFSDVRTSFTYSIDVNVDPDAGAGFDVAAYYFLRTANTSLTQSTSKTPALGDVLSFALVDDGGGDVGQYSILSNGSDIGTLVLEPASDTNDDDPSYLRLVGTFAQDENDNFDLSLEVFDLSTPTPTSLSVFTNDDIAQADVASASTLYAAFGGRARNDAGVFNIDNVNLSVTVIPEPSSLALLGLGGLAALTRDRRAAD